MIRILQTIIVCICVSGSAFAVINKSLASLKEEIVSQRDVEIHYFLQKMMYHYKNQEKLKEKLDGKILAKELANYILERVVFLEAKSFDLAKVDSTQVKREGSKVLARILNSNHAAQWKALGVETTELDIFIEQKMRSRKFIGIKRKSAEVLVTEKEITDYMTQNNVKKEERANEKLRDRVRKYLGNKQGENQLREWFEVLRKKYQVRVF